MIYQKEKLIIDSYKFNKKNTNFYKPIFLDEEHNLEKRLILEMIEILNNKNSLNKRSDILSCIMFQTI